MSDFDFSNFISESASQNSNTSNALFDSLHYLNSNGQTIREDDEFQYLNINSRIKDYTNNTSKEYMLTIPVTKERPKPDKNKLPMNNKDDILYQIFLILWEHGPEETEGMTVKQLCDTLVSNDPSMSQISTKLSNLVSAKLNAYVKRLEKGELLLHYALSRHWSNTSPRRMLYSYKGLLAPDYQNFTSSAINRRLIQQQQRQQQQNQLQIQLELQTQSQVEKLIKEDLDSQKDSSAASQIEPQPTIPTLESIQTNSNLITGSDTKMVSQENSDVNLKNISFNFSNDYNIPYTSSPVAATLALPDNKIDEVGSHMLSPPVSSSSSISIVTATSGISNKYTNRNGTGTSVGVGAGAGAGAGAGGG